MTKHDNGLTGIQRQSGIETRAKIYRFMCEYQKRYGDTPPSQKTIGDAIGLSQRGVGKELERMATFGVVTVSRYGKSRRYTLAYKADK